MTLPDFHTFREMLEHVENGGAAYRYGGAYPIYCKARGFRDGPIEKRFDGGSSGECAGIVAFSADEQNSINWVLVSKEDWEAREEANRQWWARHYEEQAKRQSEAVTTTVFHEHVAAPAKKWFPWGLK